MMLQGPILPREVSSAAEVLAAGLRFDKSGSSTNNKDLKLNIDTDVDFEHLYDNMETEIDDDFVGDYYDDGAHDMMDDMDDAMMEEYYYIDDDDEYEFMEDDAMDEEEKEEIMKKKEERARMTEEERMAEKKKRHQEREAKLEELKKKRGEQRTKRAEKMKEKDRRRAIMKERQQEKMEARKGLDSLRHGEPLLKTYRVTAEGWYRYCISPISDIVCTLMYDYFVFIIDDSFHLSSLFFSCLPVFVS